MKTLEHKAIKVIFPTPSRFEQAMDRASKAPTRKLRRKFEWNDCMPYGKYRGQTIKSIFQKDQNYLRWVDENTEIAFQPSVRRCFVNTPIEDFFIEDDPQY